MKSKLKKVILPLSVLSLPPSIAPSIADTGPINQCKQPQLSDSVSVFARPVVQLRLQLLLPRKRLNGE